MEYNNHYMTKKSFYTAAGILAAFVAVAMITCLTAASIREDNLKNELSAIISDTVRAKNEANNALILRYLASGTQDNCTTVGGGMSSPDKVLLYQLKEYDGRIALYGGDGMLVELLDVYVFTLPDSDRAELSSGIPLYSETELLSILQDYTS